MTSSDSFAPESNDEVARLLRRVDEIDCRDVVFDLDGTLTKFDMPWTEWIDDIVLSIKSATREEVRVLMMTPGAAWGTALNSHIAQGSISVEKVLEISERFETQYFGHEPNRRLVEALSVMSRDGRIIHLWTSNCKSTAERSLAELGILDLFATIVAREDVALGKPDAEGWEALRLSSEKRHQLLVGDSQNDAVAASAVGVDFFEISYFGLGARRTEE